MMKPPSAVSPPWKTSQASSNTATLFPPNRSKKSFQDRTPEETRELIRDLLQAAVEAGPRAGPLRAWQAYQAFDRTFREDLLPTLLRDRASVSAPRVLRQLFERMGATYIKLGQFIASSPTLFPPAYVQEFQKCLDQTEPLPWSTMEAVLTKELGPLDRTFAHIDRQPLASASIAQVHAARLRNGDEVVIKVQKPGLDATLAADLGFLYGAARVLEFLQPDWERTSLAAVAGDVRQSMLEELDFTKELDNTVAFRQFLKEQNLLDRATAPMVYPEHSTSKVLTMERLHGVSLLDADTIRAQNLPTDEVILTALNIWSLSVVSMPWFHADVHAGNLLLLPADGRVGFIDFGIVGRISPKVLRSVNELSAALAMGDTEAMAVALCGMGAADAKVDTKRFGNDLERVLNRMQQMDVSVSDVADVDEGELTNLLLELVEVTENNGLKLPREFGLLVKQSLYFDRYLKILAPDVDVMSDDRVMFGGGTEAETQKALPAV